MKRFCILTLVLLGGSSVLAQQRPPQQVLFDFEDGIDAWVTNVWGGGGTVTLSAAGEPKFGSGALHSDVAGVEQGGNTISPWLPMDADWREYEWAVVSLWFRGDGTPTRASLKVETGEGEEIAQSYSYNLPMDSTDWRRISAPVGAFWNREGVPVNTQKIVRMYIGHTGTHQFEVDQIALEAPQRPVAMTRAGGDELDVTPELLQFSDGRYGLRFDPSPLLPGPASTTAEFALPDGPHEATEQFTGTTAEGEALLIAPASAEGGEATVALTLARGQESASATWTFDAVANRPLPDPTRLSLLPAPKEIELGEGAFVLPDTLDVEGTGTQAEIALRLLPRELRLQGANVSFGVQREGEAASIRLGAGCDAAANALSRLPDLPAGGYLLDVDSRGATIRANDAEGLRNGALTLIQAAESQWALTDEHAIPEMHERSARRPGHVPRFHAQNDAAHEDEHGGPHHPPGDAVRDTPGGRRARRMVARGDQAGLRHTALMGRGAGPAHELAGAHELVDDPLPRHRPGGGWRCPPDLHVTPGRRAHREGYLRGDHRPRGAELLPRGARRDPVEDGVPAGG